MAAATKKAEASAAPAAKPELLKLNKNELYVKTMQRESARSRTLALAEQYEGKPLEEFKAAWMAEAAAGRIHHEESVLAKGTSKRNIPHEKVGGWLGWMRRSGFIK